MFLTCSEHGIFMYWTCKSMKQFLSYFGLVDAKINASEKDLPVWKCNAMWREVMPIGCLFMLPNSKICCFFWLELLSSPSLWLAKTMERGKKRMLWSSTLPLMEFEAIQNMTLLIKKVFDQILSTNQQRQLIGCKDLVEAVLGLL